MNHLAALLVAAAACGAPRQDAEPAEFSFLLLGDTHFDRLEHHDFGWMEREKPRDVTQVKNYSRIAGDVLPKLLAELRDVAAARPGVKFAAQLGDFMEGLCGSPELARKQCADAVAFVREARLDVPFLITKGNHDITGPGAPEAYRDLILPFLAEQAGRKLARASFALERVRALFLFFDAYDKASLDWLEAELSRRGERQAFVLLHPPVVPFNARSMWHVYARQPAERNRLLDLLGRHRAIVLSAHLHRYGLVARKTDGGRFVQLSLSSVIPSPDAKPAQVVEGVEKYGPDLVALEPKFEPGTEADRRASLAAEAPFIAHFEHADAPGYAIVTVGKDGVRAEIYVGLGRRVWKTADLSKLLH